MGTPEMRMECLKLASQFGLHPEEMLALANRMLSFVYGNPNKEAGICGIISGQVRDRSGAAAG